MKKIFSLVLCAVLIFSCVAVLAACSGEKVIMLWGPQEHKDLYLKWAEEFRQQHADELKGYVFDFAGSGDAGAQSAMTIDPTKGAAVYSFPNDQMAILANVGALSPVFGENLDWSKSHNIESAVEATKMGDSYMAYPLQADNGYYMYYNKDAFRGTSVWDAENDCLKDDYTFRDLYNALDERGTGDSVYKDGNKNDIKLNWSNGKVCWPMASAWYVSGMFFAVGGDYDVQYNADGKQTSASCTFAYQLPEGKTSYKDGDFSIGLNAVECMKNSFLNADGKPNKHYMFADEGYNDKYMTYINTANPSAVETPLAAMVCGTWKAKDIQGFWGDDYAATYLPVLEGLDGARYAWKNFAGYKHLGVNPLCEFAQDGGDANIILLHKLAQYMSDKQSQLDRYELTGAGPSNKEALQDEKVAKDAALIALNKQYDRVCVYPQNTTVKDKNGNSMAGKPVGNGLGFRVQDSVPTNYWTPLQNFGQLLYDEFSTGSLNSFNAANITRTLGQLQKDIEKSAQ